jgi:hypothetical protein
MKICAFDPCENIRRPNSRLCGTHKSQRERGKELTAVPPKMTDAERFWSKVDKTGECWTWTDPLSPSGYGRINIGGRKGRYWQAHRLSYVMAFGAVADDMDIDHQCLNRPCVNPCHLRAATRKQNNENRSGANKNSKSGVLGVCWDKRAGKWIAQLTHNRRPMHLGYFETISEANAVVTAKRLELFTHNELDRIAA